MPAYAGSRPHCNHNNDRWDSITSLQPSAGVPALSRNYPESTVPEKYLRQTKEKGPVMPPCPFGNDRLEAGMTSEPHRICRTAASTSDSLTGVTSSFLSPSSPTEEASTGSCVPSTWIKPYYTNPFEQCDIVGQSSLSMEMSMSNSGLLKDVDEGDTVLVW